MLEYAQELSTALSIDPLRVAGALRGRNFILGETVERMLADRSSEGKSTILVEAVRKEIISSPAKFIEFLTVLSSYPFCEGVIKKIRSTYKCTL